MQSDSWKCRHCGIATETLNVHHTRYVKGAEPWEYELWQLITLCRVCHESHERARDCLLAMIGIKTGKEICDICDLIYSIDQSLEERISYRKTMDWVQSQSPGSKKYIEGL